MDNNNAYIGFFSDSFIGFARAEEDWSNVLEEDEEYLEKHPDALPLSLEGYVIDFETKEAEDLDLGFFCGYRAALEALQDVLSLESGELRILPPLAYEELCKLFEVGAYEPLR